MSGRSSNAQAARAAVTRTVVARTEGPGHVNAGPPDAGSPLGSATAAVAAGRRSRRRRYACVCLGLSLLVAAMLAVSLMCGHTAYSPREVLRVLAGQTVPGASFTVGELRLPRAATGLLAGAAFGMAGATFQTMLGNPLASPDIIGITSGASAAAVFSIVVLSLSETAVSLVATLAALCTAGLIYALSCRGGMSGTRLILMGIGIAAMLKAFVSWTLARAAQWDLQVATRWLHGNLQNSTWEQTLPLLCAVLLAGPGLFLLSRRLDTLRMGEEASAALGVPVERTRIMLIVLAVVLIAFATAAAGPIAFVSFLAGPIAARFLRGAGPPLLPAALVGALLVLAADFAGQFATGVRFPVGVVTGVVGAPYLIYLLARTSRSARSGVTGGSQ